MAKLVRYYVDNLKLPSISIHLLSDLRDVLFWVRDIPSKRPTFVANRCSEISTLLPDAHWYHVNSAENPASRRDLASELIDYKLWWPVPKDYRM